MTNFFPPSAALAVPRAQLRVTQQSRAPTSNSEGAATFPWGPLNVASFGDPFTSSGSTWSGIGQHRLWANRCPFGGHNTNGNPVQPYIFVASGKQAGMDFTTISKANAATAARLAYSAGYAQNEADGVSGWGDIATAAGLATMTWASANTNKEATFTTVRGTYATVSNTIILPAARLCDLTGLGGREFSIDYEPQDNRTTTDTLAVVAQCVTLAHGKGFKFGFYTNPLDGTGGTPYNGLLGVQDSVLASCDFFGLLVYGFNASGAPAVALAYQIGLFTSPDCTKFQVTYGIGCYLSHCTTLADAQAVRDVMRVNGFAGVEFYYQSGAAGGDCSTNSGAINQIAALVGVTGC